MHRGRLCVMVAWPTDKNTARDQIISRSWRLMEVLYDCNNILVVTSVSVLVSIIYLDNVTTGLGTTGEISSLSLR